MVKTCGLAASVLLGWVLCAAQPAMAQEPGITFPSSLPQLFTRTSDAAPVDLVVPSATPSVPAPRKRHQAVQIDFAQLSEAHEALAEGRRAELAVNLPNLSLPVVLSAASDTLRGYAVSGRVANDPLSAVNIVVNGRSVAGNIRRAGKLHTIRTAGAGYYVQTLDDLTMPRCDVARLSELYREAAQVPLPRGPAANIVQDDSALDDGSEIDVLVVYTPSGRRSAGGHQGIRTLMEMLVQETNQAYSDSDVRQRIRLVAATEVDYELQNFSAKDALRHLTRKEDGYMDEVHQIRDLYSADLVLLFRPVEGGVAWIPDPSSASAERWGFAVSNWHAFTHELGHNMGLMHERGDDPGNLPYPYSHGYNFRHRGVPYGTIMSTDEGVFRFSNPRHLYPNDLGVPLGVPGDAPTSSPDGPADAARSLNETAAAVANFRPSAARCRYRLPSPNDITAQGGSFVISVATAPDCSWDALSLDHGLSINAGFSGTGNGQVAFAVEENTGWPRELALRVAGEIHSFRQDGGRQSISVCDRSGNVREAISAALDDQPCADIAVEDIARIGSLTVHGNISPGDLDGLTGLGELVIQYFDEMGWPLDVPPRLDQGTFAGAGLENLHSLHLFAGGATPLHLRNGVFEGLDALQQLYLYGISWEGGAFEDVPRLDLLGFHNYPLKILPDGAFLGLNSLRRIWSIGGRFEAVGDRAFEGLFSLRELDVTNSRLAQLPVGVFENLPELTSLVLGGNRLTTLRRGQFKGASKLLLIDLSFNPIRVVEAGAFSELPLRQLYLIDLDLTSLGADVFRGLFNCRVSLSGNRLTTLDPRVFAGARLVSLDLSDNYISDISFLASLGYGQEVDLSGNRVVDVAPLASIGGLSTLNLSRNRIVDVSPLVALSDQLTYLDLSHNEIGDISPLLVRNDLIEEGSALFLHGNRLQDAASGEHIAMLRSLGVRVFDVRVWPMDSSALEGEEFEFTVRLSSAVEDSVALDWQLVVAEDPLNRQTELADVILTSSFGDVGRYFRRGSCSAVGICYIRGLGGEVTMRAGNQIGYLTVPVLTNEVMHEEEHETFALVLFSQASMSSSGVALDTSVPELRGLFRTPRHSLAVGLIVDPAGPSHHVPLFLAREDAWGRRSVLRLVHPLDGSPAHIEAFDGLGRRHGATTLSTREGPSRQRPHPSRRAVAQFDSDDLEDGNHERGLSKGVAAGSSNWHLKVWANDARVLSYVRHVDGFLTSAHDVARQRADRAYEVPIFDAAGDTRQRNILRLVNPGKVASKVRIVGTDDAGANPGEAVELSIEPGGVRELSAADLEAGEGDLSGALGDGQGMWRLTVASDGPILVASLLESPSGHLTNLSTIPNNKERGDGGATTHHVPLFLSAADEWGRHSFLRVVNKDENAAIVRIRPFDDTGRHYGSVNLTVAAGEVAYFNSHHLEVGGGGLSSGVGVGEGDWRLELEAMEDIDVLAYVRHADGFLTSMHDVVRASAERHVVPIFNSADDGQKGRLRLVNPRGEDAEVSIRGTDDRGVASDRVRLVVPARRSRTITAQEMEAGHDAIEGALGNGEGKWRLVVRSDVQIQVMSLLEGTSGHLANLSTTPLR